MPDFTVAELENIAASTLDFYEAKRKVEAQTLQDKPLLAAIRAAKTSFPGGKENISFAVKGEYTTTIQGFQNDDVVGYANPANTKRGQVPWFLIHAGIQFSMHELLKDGISITDSTTGKGTSEHSDRDLTALVNILNEKFEDMEEGSDRGLNTMYWADGTQDATLVPGVRSFIVNDPTSATVVHGIDQSANTWWRNRASLALDAGTPSNNVVSNKLQDEYRQLRRYGGNPKMWLAGSDFIEALEQELRASGTYTQDGFMSKGKTDTGMADISFKGNGIQYDPTLDDDGLAKYMFVMDMKHIKPRVIEGEDGKKHNPARPENKYVFYRAKTWAEGLYTNKRNAHGVYSIA